MMILNTIKTLTIVQSGHLKMHLAGAITVVHHFFLCDIRQEDFCWLVYYVAVHAGQVPNYPTLFTSLSASLFTSVFTLPFTASGLLATDLFNLRITCSSIQETTQVVQPNEHLRS